MAKSALGRGLGSLIPQGEEEETEIEVINEQPVVLEEANPRILDIAPDDIEPNPHQPRQHFDHWQMEDLMNSIKQHGILQPLVVTVKDGDYELVAGERRLRAATMLKLETVPVIVREMEELEKLELALVENIQRADLNAIEEAEAYSKFIEEFGLTQQVISEKVGKPRSVVANKLRLLNLPDAMQTALAEKKITEGHAKVLLGIKNEAEQSEYFEELLHGHVTVRDLETKVQEKSPHKFTSRTTVHEPQIAAFEEELQEFLGTRVRIKKKGDGGTIFVDYYSEPELTELHKKITKKR